MATPLIIDIGTKPRIIGVSALALLWWVLAWFNPYPLLSDPAYVIRLLALMGLVYLLTATWFALTRPAPWNTLFLLYAACFSIHWAGPLGGTEDLLARLLFTLYVIFGSAAFGSLFLHLALEYPARVRLGNLIYLVYLPPVIAAIAGLFFIVEVIDLNTVSLTFAIGSNFGLAGGVVWLYRLWVGSGIGLPRTANLLVTLALILSWAPNALYSLGLFDLGDAGGLTNLSALALLIALAWLASHVKDAP